MIGDKLVIKPEHYERAAQIVDAAEARITDKFAISVGGESGSGKSEMAEALRKTLEDRGFPAQVICQDDYFIFPPKTCHRMRQLNIEQVGMFEARLDFMDANIRSFKQGDDQIYKPLSIYQEDRLTTELLDVGDTRVLIAEGTYTTALTFTDLRVFIDRSYRDTESDRKKRNRDDLSDMAFMDAVLTREHKIISAHRELADFIISRDLKSLQVK